jgi:hypothetical protein
MRTQSSVLFALLFTFLPLTHVLAQSDLESPTGVIISEAFTGGTSNPWLQVRGTWSVANGTYGNAAAAGANISVITLYRDLHPASPPSEDLAFSEFFLRARVLNLGSDDTHHVGIVYGYRDSRNYHELVISAIGHVRVRSVIGGVAFNEQPDFGVTECTRNIWCELEVRQETGVITVKVNGQIFFQPFLQADFSGKIGLVTHAAVGRFDKVFVGVPFGDQPFLETFDGVPSVTFTPQSGNWFVANGSYRNSAIQQTSVTLAPINSGRFSNHAETPQYTFRARMLNPYANSGNTVGIVFNYAGSRYSEVVFSPTGVARINLVENGVVARTVATANYGGTRNVAFEVELQNASDVTTVLVNGKALFDDIVGANPLQFPEGGVGLITHWAPGRFDNVQFDHGAFSSCALTFDVPFPPFSSVSGSWNTNGGTLNSTAVGESDIFNADCSGYVVGEQAGTNELYSARLLNEFGARGNRVGLTYNYQAGTGEFFEVVFSPTGIMQLNKTIQGVRYPVRSGTHNIPRNTWFDVQVIRSGIFTTIKVNGTTLLENEPQGELRGGTVGAITHFTKGRFDDLVLRPHVVRPPSEL